MINRPSLLLATLALGLWAAPAVAQWGGSNQAEVSLDGNGQSWFVRATVNGTVRGLFLLDTGASFCVLAPATARRLNAPASSTRVTLRTANGTVQAPVVRLSSVEIGGARARDVQAVVHDAVAPPLDGIIGLSFLNNFTYSVDPRRRVLRLR